MANHTSRRVYRHTDCLGIDINSTDTVVVSAWGVARLIDCGIRSRVVRINRVNVVIIDADGRERAVRPSELCVLRRDGEDGLEGNNRKDS